ncbi:MAG: tryptophan synthase subunit alpha [bacterium]|nr:tryptophan synthase subunit alpha [bacterium]
MTVAALRARFAEAAGRGCFSPFFVLGDPTAEETVALARASVAAGASMLELGIPYRDPCADGSAIQRACQRAFAAGSTTDRALETLAAIARDCPGVPLNLLVYGNLVHARGVDEFCREAAAAGASSLLVPDLPLGEDAALVAAAERHAIGLVRLVGPRTATARVQASASGCVMLYVAGVQGVTGAPVAEERGRLLARVATATAGSVPLCAGFGLSSRRDVEDAFAHGAAVAVVGSHLAELIARCHAADESPVGPVAAAVRELAVTDPSIPNP